MKLKIGNLTLENPFILAPLAGYTDLAFRQLCREYGAGLCYSEMISCHGLVYRQKNTLDMIRTCAAERPVAMQLFGDEPDLMGEAAAVLSETPIDLIDINMGCPVKKVIKKGAGAALLKNMELAGRIIEAVKKNSKVPVTVKTRTGWNHHSLIAPEFARMTEQTGASGLILHARTWTDGFSGPVDWQMIQKVKESVTIPVIGNGDIHSYEEGLAMIRNTGCDGVMIGRAAVGAPWIFSPTCNPMPSLQYRLKALQRHLELFSQHRPAEKILARIKNQAGKYFRGLPQGAAIRKKIYDTGSFSQLEKLIQQIRDNSQ